MHDIFLSYARQDRERVRPIVRALEENGWSVWWDPKIVAGEEFRDTIEAALNNARCVVVVWSNDSVRSRWVLDEAQKGSDRRVLVPVLLDGISPPLGFGQVHAASLTTSENASVLDLEGMIAGVSKVLGSETNAVKVSDESSEIPLETRKWRAEKTQLHNIKDVKGNLKIRLIFNSISNFALAIFLFLFLAVIFQNSQPQGITADLIFSVSFSTLSLYTYKSVIYITDESKTKFSKSTALFSIFPAILLTILTFISIAFTINTLNKIFAKIGIFEIGDTSSTNFMIISFLVGIVVSVVFGYRLVLKVLRVAK